MELEASPSAGSLPDTGRAARLSDPQKVRLAVRPRIAIALGRFLGILLSAAPVCGAAPAATSVPPTRHVVVVENSANMKAQREQTADLLSRAMLDGFRGRIRIGEVVELWVVENDVTTNALPAFRWHPIAAIDDSNSAFRYLRALKSSAKTVAFDGVFSRLDLANPAIPRLLVYLATSGSDPIRGTPWDEPINRILRDHQRGLAAKGQPFITVLAAQGGEWVGHGVTPGDRIPFVPSFPPLEVKPEPSVETPATNPPARPVKVSAEVPAEPKPMTVDEIAVKMRDAALERSLTSAPPALVESPTQEVAVARSSLAPAVRTGPEPAAARPLPTNSVDVTAPKPVAPKPLLTNREPPAVMVTHVGTSLPTGPAQTPLSTNAPRDPAEGVPPLEPELAASQPSEPEPDEPLPFTAPPQAHGHAPGLSLWKDLLLGVALLAAAVALAVLLIRQLTHRPRASLISQSLGPPLESSKPPSSSDP